MSRRLVHVELANDPATWAEDDGLRSAHVRDLLQRSTPTESRPRPQRIPRVIVQFWDDPRRLPADVRECLDSWQPLTEAGFTRVLFDDDRARRFISGVFGRTTVAAFDRCHHPAMRCDFFRLCYLVARGGLYVDADEFYLGGSCDKLLLNDMLKVQPLCYDPATDSMVASSVFHERAFPSDYVYYVNNNPLVAPPFHPVIRLALTRATRLLLNESGHREIQSTTGPGNLTASLVKHSIASKLAGKEQDFDLLKCWDAISTSRWPLSYRDDMRNWRLWDPNE